MKIKQKAHFLEPTIWIGKKGLSEKLVEETKKQLKNKKIIKIRFLKAALRKTDKKALTAELTKRTGAKLVKRTGFVAVLYKRDTKKNTKEIQKKGTKKEKI